MRTWSLRILRQVFRLALSALHWLTVAMVTTCKSRTALQVENLALRHQLAVLRRSVKLPTHLSRSTAVGLVMRSLERLAIFLADRQAGNRHWLAPQGAFGCSGPGRFIAANLGVPLCPKKFGN